MSRDDRRLALGDWLVRRYRLAAAQRGVQTVARQLRKQGAPLAITLRILGIRPSQRVAADAATACDVALQRDGASRSARG